MRIPIRYKLAGALAVPVLALAGVTAAAVAQAGARAQEASEETQLAAAAVGPGSLIGALQDERNFMIVSILGITDLAVPVSSTAEARAATEAAIAELEELIAGSGEEVATAFAAGLQATNTTLDDLRAQIDASPTEGGLANYPVVDQFDGVYTEIILTLVEGSSAVGLSVNDHDLRTGVELVSMATRDQENFGDVLDDIAVSLLGGGTIEEARVAANGSLQRLLSLRELILSRSTGAYGGIAEDLFSAPEEVARVAAFQSFVDSGALDADQLATVLSSDEVISSVRLRDEAAEVMQARADSIVQDAEDQRQLAIFVGAILVLAALGVTIAASRSITAPLQSLTRQARTMASERLPSAVQQVLDTPVGEDVTVPEVEPITVRTRDEVADVAAALNTVQTSALDLAVEQAALRKNISDSFVNLGRRNQNLLDRQLELITDLEQNEQEPDRLEELFGLDRCAVEELQRHSGRVRCLRQGAHAPLSGEGRRLLDREAGRLQPGAQKAQMGGSRDFEPERDQTGVVALLDRQPPTPFVHPEEPGVPLTLSRRSGAQLEAESRLPELLPGTEVGCGHDDVPESDNFSHGYLHWSEHLRPL